jgi:hypothetical protein
MYAGTRSRVLVRLHCRVKIRGINQDVGEEGEDFADFDPEYINSVTREPQCLLGMSSRDRMI